MNLQALDSQLKKAIDVRESGDLVSSRKLFENLVSQVKSFLTDSSDKEFKDFYVTVMGEYVIQYRLEGGVKYFEALKLGRELLDYDQKNGIGNFLALRSVAHTLQNLGDFEEAEEYLRKIVDLAKDDKFKQGAELCHLALCVFRQSRVEEALKLVDQGITQLKEVGPDYKYSNVPYSRALMFKALILNSKNETKEALKLAQESLLLAKKDNLVFRVKQAEKLVKFLEAK